MGGLYSVSDQAVNLHTITYFCKKRDGIQNYYVNPGDVPLISFLWYQLLDSESNCQKAPSELLRPTRSWSLHRQWQVPSQYFSKRQTLFLRHAVPFLPLFVTHRTAFVSNNRHSDKRTSYLAYCGRDAGAQQDVFIISAQKSIFTFSFWHTLVDSFFQSRSTFLLHFSIYYSIPVFALFELTRDRWGWEVGV